MGLMLVTGATGYLGGTVARRAAGHGWTVVGTGFTGPSDVRLDIRAREAVQELFGELRPDAVIHTAAGRDDWRTIADGSAHVALAATGVGARLVHVSSDAVFAGRPEQYDESAVPDPVYAYGAAKAAAETAVRAIAPSAAVVRTSLIMGDGRGAQERLTHALVRREVEGVLFTDQIRQPVHVDDLADALIELATVDCSGVLNVAGSDAINRYDLGVLVAQRDGLDPAALPAAQMADLGVVYPGELRLRLDRATSLLRTRLRGVQEFLGLDRGNS